MKKRFASYILLIFIWLGSCMNETNEDGLQGGPDHHLVLLAIDRDALLDESGFGIFSENELEGMPSATGRRDQIPLFFEDNGQDLKLLGGEVGDEAFFAFTAIPNKWINAGPSDNGAKNFLLPGPGLGAPNIDGDSTVLLDRIQDVAPLRAMGLGMLVGYKVLAIVYAGDIQSAYSPNEVNLQGKTLGVMAFEVMSVEASENTDKLPMLSVKLLDVDQMDGFALALFTNAPIPIAYKEPFDVIPSLERNAPAFKLAN